MSYVLTKTPHQRINTWGISSQWEGTHTRFDEDPEGTILSLIVRQKIKDNPVTYKEYEIKIKNAEDIFKLVNNDENHFIYNAIHSAWLQGWHAHENNERNNL